ncbi:MAG: hypothetical protein AMJ46_00275 [Latescibacteria bacterium DG_63]|nr:MAG: hypothetical protein AMJ46_00275 [Latescibacteria bacterium DG_63]
MTKREEQLVEKAEYVLEHNESRQFLHRHLSTDCFNKCWALMEKKNRTPENEEDMILLTHTSLWHWKQRDDCQPLNLSIAYWQLGRAYCLAKNTAMAKYYGQKCVEISTEKSMPPFYVGYGYEVLAHASALEGNAREAEEYLRLANMELEKITIEKNKKLLKADLKKVEQILNPPV